MMKKSTPFGEIEINDAHVHFFSYRYFRLLASQSPTLKNENDAVSKIGEITGLSMPPASIIDFTNLWIDELNRNHLARAMIMASIPGDEDSVAEAVRIFPDRFYGAFFFNPLVENAVEKAERAFEALGLKVVCLFPAMYRFSVADNEVVREVVKIVRRQRGRAIFVHCGALSIGIRQRLGLQSLFDLRFSNPLEVHKLASEFTDVNFIIPHFGAGLWREALMTAELCPNVYLDTSSSNRWIKYQSADLDIRRVFERTIDLIGAERLLFGTDSSFFPRGWNSEIFDTQVKALYEIGISKDDAEKILGGNLRKLLD